MKEFLAKLPNDVLLKVELTEDRIVLPVKVDSKSFYRNHSKDIEQDELTDEKAIYIASIYKPSNFLLLEELIYSKVKRL